MRHVSHLARLSAAGLLVLVGVSLGRSQSGTDEKQAVVGAWRAESIGLVGENGEKTTLPNETNKGPFCFSISEETITAWEGNQKFAEIPYVSDPKQTPAIIDVKYKDQDMSGIYELNGESLKISLNYADKGRPQDFSGINSDMDLVLKRFQGRPLMLVNIDGSNLHPLGSLPAYGFGTSDWSPDGKKIAVDTWNMLIGDDWPQSHVYVLNADGSSPTDLGDGTLPSWLPDGKRITYSRRNPSGRIWIMNADGSDKQMIDENGWSSDWSPKKDKDEIAFTSGNNICVLDLKTKQRRMILKKEYNGIYWGIVWSPDGQWICFIRTARRRLRIGHRQWQRSGQRL